MPQIGKSGKATLLPGGLQFGIAIQHAHGQGQQAVFIEIQHAQKITFSAGRRAFAEPPCACCGVVVGQLQFGRKLFTALPQLGKQGLGAAKQPKTAVYFNQPACMFMVLVLPPTHHRAVVCCQFKQ